MRAVKRLRAQAQHIDEARLVENWIGVRRADHAGDAACCRGGQLRSKRAAFDVNREINQSRRDDAALGVDVTKATPVGRLFNWLKFPSSHKLAA